MGRVNIPLLEVSIGRSTSKRFKLVHDMLRSRPDYKCYARDEKTYIDPPEYTATYNLLDPGDRLEALRMGLMSLKWVNTRFVLKNVSYHYNALHSVNYCASRYAEDNYCFGRETPTSPDIFLWGCRLLRDICDDDRDAWYRHGHLDDGVFYLHKEDIRAELYQEAVRCGAFFCPYFDFNTVERVLANLPNELDPETDCGWDYLEAWQGGRMVRVGVTPSRSLKVSRSENPPRYWD